MKFIYRIYIGILVFCAAGLPAWSVTGIDVKDATAEQGDTVTVRVEIDLDDQLPAGTSSISMRLSYRSNRLAFTGVSGTATTGGCASPSVLENIAPPGEFGYITLSCGDIQQNHDSAAFDLKFLVLAGQQSSAVITAENIILNNDTLTDVTISPGLVTISGDEPFIFPTYPEGLNLNYPNPFNVETRFFYIVDNPTSVRFKVFDHVGRLVFEDNLGAQNRGIYAYTISPFAANSQWQNWNKSSGLYVLVMETNTASYRRTFMYLK